MDHVQERVAAAQQRIGKDLKRRQRLTLVLPNAAAAPAAVQGHDSDDHDDEASDDVRMACLHSGNGHSVERQCCVPCALRVPVML